MEEKVKEILARRLERVKERIVANMAAQGRNASGRSAASLKVEVEDGRGVLLGSSSFLHMERGRGPGKVPYGFRDIIRQWAVDKGIAIRPKSQRQTAEAALNSFAGAVAYGIMKKGTRLRRGNGFDDIYSSAFDEEMELMAVELGIGFAEQIMKINDALQ